MELGMIIQFGGVFPGREQEAVDAFTDAIKLYVEKLGDDTFTSFEPFMYETGDIRDRLGFFIIKGDETKLRAFMESEEAMTLRTEVAQVCEHLRIELLDTGDRVVDQVTLFNKVAEAMKAKAPATV